MHKFILNIFIPIFAQKHFFLPHFTAFNEDVLVRPVDSRHTQFGSNFNLCPSVYFVSFQASFGPGILDDQMEVELFPGQVSDTL